MHTSPDVFVDLPTSKQPSDDTVEQIDTDDLLSQITGSSLRATVARQVFSSQVSGFKSVASIDKMKPHFDVEPPTILNRLLGSFTLYQKGQSIKDTPDLYGPLMAVITLVALLHIRFQQHSTSFAAGVTKIGRALGLSAGFWIMFSLGIWFALFLFGTNMSLLNGFLLCSCSTAFNIWFGSIETNSCGCFSSRC
ncbi:hypothetical protein GEMRC1_011538 [Eukaryota sp. GEM-RC1]